MYIYSNEVFLNIFFGETYIVKVSYFFGPLKWLYLREDFFIVGLYVFMA